MGLFRDAADWNRTLWEPNIELRGGLSFFFWGACTSCFRSALHERVRKCLMETFSGSGKDLPHEHQWLPPRGGGSGCSRTLIAHGAAARAGHRAGWPTSIACCGG